MGARVLESLGAWIFRHRISVLVVSALVLSLAVASLVRGGPLTGGAIEGLEADRAQTLVDLVSGRRADTTFLAIFRPSRPEAAFERGAFAGQIDAALERVRHDPRVLSVLSPSGPPSPLTANLWSEKAGAALVFVSMAGNFATALGAYPEVRSELGNGPLTVTCTGKLPFTHDLNVTLEHDLLKAEVVSLPIALLLLLLVFRTLTAAVLPVGVGALSVVCAIAVVLALAHHVDIAQYSINVCSLIGLGVAIDYSLFIVSRYREELAHGHDYDRALALALGTAGRVVLFSGFAVGTGLAGLFFFHGSFLFTMGVGGAIVVALAVAFALTFLPALLAVLGPKIDAGRVLGPRRAKEGGWHRMALFVMRRPLATLIPTLGVLLLMGYPFLHLRLVSADVRVLDQSVEARNGYELLKRDFPEQGATRIDAVIEFPGGDALDPARSAALGGWLQAVRRLPSVARVESALDLPAPLGRALFARGGLTLVHVLSEDAPESERTRDIVRFLRAHRNVADGRALVGGQTAEDLDATEFMLSRVPYAAATVVGVTVVVLFFLLHSVVLPLKAVVMNFLSIAGSFGGLVWLFQEGHLFVREPRPLEPSLPVLLFCIVFGLSMDYEVLMLSRMKEAYERSGENALAVAEGLEKSAGLITSAAAIMVAVFAAFALARVVLIEAVGVGMALAVTLDATLVRVLLVPSTMRLFGDLNWWAPRFLGARRPPR